MSLNPLSFSSCRTLLLCSIDFHVLSSPYWTISSGRTGCLLGVYTMTLHGQGLHLQGDFLLWVKFSVPFL